MSDLWRRFKSSKVLVGWARLLDGQPGDAWRTIAMSEPKYEYRMPDGMVLQSIDADDEPHEADFTTFSKAALAARDAATRKAALTEAADAIRAGATPCSPAHDYVLHRLANHVERLIGGEE